MTSTVELYDKAIISRQPNFDERKTRSEFRKVIPNLKTVVVHCFDPRVTGGIPPAVAKALPGQVYPGEVFEFVGEDGKKKIGSNTTIFPVVVAGGRASGSAQRSISIACHLFDIDNVAIVHHTDCGGTMPDAAPIQHNARHVTGRKRARETSRAIARLGRGFASLEPDHRDGGCVTGGHAGRISAQTKTDKTH